MKNYINKTNITKAALAALAALAAAVVSPLGVTSTYAASKASFGSNPSSVTITRKIEGIRGDVSNTYGYTITASGNNPSGVTGAPTSASINLNDTVAGTRTVTGSTTVELSDIVFPKIGDYEYTLAETSSTNASAFPVSSTTYTIGISVRNNTSLNGYVASLYIKNAAGEKLDGNEAMFSESREYTYIELAATASGDGADINKCFAYKVNLVGAGAGKFTVRNATCSGNPASVSNGDTIYAKHGDHITIGLGNQGNELALDANYSFTKTEDESYVVTWDGTGTGNSSSTKVAKSVSSANFDTTNKITVNENLTMIPNTGLIITVLPYALLAVFGGFMASAFMKNRRISKDAQ